MASKHYQSVKYIVWYPGPTGRSIPEIAFDVPALRDIRSRLDRLGLRYRIARYYYIS